MIAAHAYTLDMVICGAATAKVVARQWTIDRATLWMGTHCSRRRHEPQSVRDDVRQRSANPSPSRQLRMLLPRIVPEVVGMSGVGGHYGGDSGSSYCSKGRAL